LINQLQRNEFINEHSINKEFYLAANNGDFWVLKLDSEGAVSWQKRYGDALQDGASSIQQTADGGYIVAGSTFAIGSGLDDVWILKLDSEGAVSWQKKYGGGGVDSASSIQQTTDAGYIVAGKTYSFGADTADFWVLKLSSDVRSAGKNSLALGPTSAASMMPRIQFNKQPMEDTSLQDAPNPVIKAMIVG
jgi:hypothetical protein